MTTYGPLNLTLREQRSNDAELLAMIAAYLKPRSVAEMFDGCSPRWAVDAADRLQAAGLVTEGEHGRLSVSEQGRKAG